MTLTGNNINLRIPGASFNIDGMDIAMDYQRDEGFGNFLSRGSSFAFGHPTAAGELEVTFRLEDGAGGFTPITLPSDPNDRYLIPDDDEFRRYAFRYDPNTGVATLTATDIVNNIVLSTNTYTHSVVGRKLYWTGAGDMVIGAGIWF
jgi:hypothetical protein